MTIEDGDLSFRLRGGSLLFWGCGSLESGPGAIIPAEIDSMELEITLEKKPCSKIVIFEKVRAI